MILRAGLPDDALTRLHARHPDRYPVLLESVGGSASLGRHDVLMALPGERLTLRSDGSLEGPAVHGGVAYLDALDRWWRAARNGPADDRRAPFTGGWFLYLGYELASVIEPTLRMPKPLGPRAVAWRMRGAVVRDRVTGECWCEAEDAAAARLAGQVADDLRCADVAPDASQALLSGEVIEDEPEVFLRGVGQLLECIARGDVYQANLSRGWRATLRHGAGAADLYRRLRRVNPGPFAGIAALPEFTIISSSPERLLQLQDGVASTRPIAGTRPRGHTASHDDSLKQELVLNEKERAEHIMLVDLERNDLGRICRGGSVEVDEFMTVETYATVHHIVSNVRGVLRPDVTPGQSIAAVFPGGTITGCPKVRCIQLLADVECAPREAYTGSMGYLGRDGSLDLNILIRTLTVTTDRIAFRTGSGIVADSRAEAELEETRAKAQGLLRALGGQA